MASNPVLKLFDETKKAVIAATGEGFEDLHSYELKYGIPGFISTGLPSFDLHLPHNLDRTSYGYPRGRIVEVFGDSGSYKSTLCYAAAAEVIASGGIVYHMTSEMDLNEQYASTFLAHKGLNVDFKDIAWGGRPITTIKQMAECIKPLMRHFEALADEIEASGEVPLEKLPPILIICDSFGALLGDRNRERIEESWDQGDQMGSHAKEIHDFFKFFLKSWARCGVTFMYTNHTRANLSQYGPSDFPAHNFVLKYYPFLRIRVQATNRDSELKKTPTRKGVSFKIGNQLNIKVYKKRGEFVASGEFDLRYFYNHGFDYWGSLIDACVFTGVANVRAGKYTFELDLEESSRLKKFNGTHSEKELRELMKADHLAVLELEEYCLMSGPRELEDMR